VVLGAVQRTYSAVGRSSRSFCSATSRGMSPASLVSTGTAFLDLQAGAARATRTSISRAWTRIIDLLSGFRAADFVALLDRAFLLDLGGAVGIFIVRLRDLQDLGPRDLLAVAEDQDLLARLQREPRVELDEHAVRLAHELDLAHAVRFRDRVPGRILRRGRLRRRRRVARRQFQGLEHLLRLR